jgi:hypothetical protein
MPRVHSGLSYFYRSYELYLYPIRHDKRNAYRILVGKPEGKRRLRRPRRRWVDNIKMDLSEMGWYGLD